MAWVSAAMALSTRLGAGCGGKVAVLWGSVFLASAGALAVID
jgi:hypothetical protein